MYNSGSKNANYEIFNDDPITYMKKKADKERYLKYKDKMLIID